MIVKICLNESKIVSIKRNHFGHEKSVHKSLTGRFFLNDTKTIF